MPDCLEPEKGRSGDRSGLLLIRSARELIFAATLSENYSLASGRITRAAECSSGHIDDQQLERLAPDIGAHVPLPYRFQDEISRFVDVALTGLHVGHTQAPG